ncbi:MAG TPA: inorganic phosphate transporter, partial [Methanocorpusculum sp.]|nr:inorganic phosphate transporter [Methanocorpusculum sp.]
STTHVATGTIMGPGVTRGTGAVRWGAVRQMVTAWILTIPAAAAVSGICYLAARLVFGF